MQSDEEEILTESQQSVLSACSCAMWEEWTLLHSLLLFFFLFPPPFFFYFFPKECRLWVQAVEVYSVNPTVNEIQYRQRAALLLALFIPSRRRIGIAALLGVLKVLVISPAVCPCVLQCSMRNCSNGHPLQTATYWAAPCSQSIKKINLAHFVT